MFTTSIPHGHTARRLEWVHLPPLVRDGVERRLGSPVVDAESRRAGYTPGLASVLACEDGSRHFVKAASTKAQRGIANAYAEEARKLRMLPPGAPAPRLLWEEHAHDWVVLGIEYVDARLPERPWTEADLATASAMLVEAAEVLTPAPGIGLATYAEEFAALPECWDHLRSVDPGIPHLEEGAALAADFASVVVGDTLVHTDIRDDNVLLRTEGGALLCDWNWPVVGAAWIDSLMLLIGPRGDGLDVEAHLAAHPLLAEVPAEAIDRVLALLTGFFMKNGDAPVPSTSPYVREVARWQGVVCWDWLRERRGWL